MQSLRKSLLPHFNVPDRVGGKEETNQKRFTRRSQNGESNNNRLKAKKGRQSLSFTGTVEAVKRIVKEEEEDFAQAVEGVSRSYELRPEFAKFAVPDFMDWKKREIEEED